MHGEAFVREETDIDLDLPTGTVVYNAVFPISKVVFPLGFFICHTCVRDILSVEFPSLRFAPVYVKNAISVPWRKWIQRGKCRYPKAGEPEDYFAEYEKPEDFEPGFSTEYWSLEIEDFVNIDGGFVRSGYLPRVRSSIPEAPFAWGDCKPGMRCSNTIFCSDKVIELLWDFREVLDLFILDRES